MKNYTLFSSFTEDIIVDGIGVLSLPAEDLKTLELTADKYNLDFDDAYQYTVAAKYEMQLISFDTDFDQTDRKRMEPCEVLQSIS